MRKLFLPTLVTLLILTVGIGYLASSKQSLLKESPSTPATVSEKDSEDISLVLDFGGGHVLSYALPFKEERTAFSVLREITEKKNIALETQEYDFGIFVESIDGKESSAEMAWIYFVNRESGNVAADRYVLKGGDLVEWRYVRPSD